MCEDLNPLCPSVSSDFGELSRAALCQRGEEPTCELCLQMKRELDDGNYRKVREEEKELRQCIENLVETCEKKLPESEGGIGSNSGTCGGGTTLQGESLIDIAQSVPLDDLSALGLEREQLQALRESVRRALQE